MTSFKSIAFVAALFIICVVSGCSSSKNTNSTMTTKEPEIITTPSGLQYVDLKVGTGAQPKVGQTIVVNCTGRLIDSTIFWSTFDPQFGPVQPLESPIGVHRLIAGWDEGMLTMKVGGKRKLIIPSNLGYGSAGRPPSIPPNSTLVFEIELLGVK